MSIIKANNNFFKELKSEVYTFLENHNIPKKQSRAIQTKAVLLFAIWGLFYTLYLTMGQVHFLWAIGFSVLWATAMLPIQMAVMHDASHGASSENPKMNEFLVLSISFLGGSSLLWKEQHCKAHHSFTNIHGMDHDINTGGILRLHPSQPLLSYHKYQQYYAWLLYPLFVLSWIWWGDFRDVLHNTYSINKRQLRNALIESILVKVWHVGLFLVLPMIMLNSIWLALFCYVLSFSILGFIMVVVFQLAHITEKQSLANSVSELSDDWAIRQLLTTANFATHNSFLTWFTGGLNFQIEHHIFPFISHINYPKIQQIVQRKCKEEGVPYLSFPTVMSTVGHHQKHLRIFGSELQPSQSPSAN